MRRARARAAGDGPADPRVHPHLRKSLYDEASIAEAQARHVGATYHPIPITGREIAESFADAIWHAETQMFNGHGVAKFLLSRAVRAAGIQGGVHRRGTTGWRGSTVGGSDGEGQCS
jgi:asparagine synthetase B (glutamine-hydrolysing)